MIEENFEEDKFSEVDIFICWAELGVSDESTQISEF
jgi:hypothetical protein